MGKGLILFGLFLLVAAFATRADCDNLSEAECERRNQMIDGVIG